MSDARAWVDLLIEKGEALRKAGVLRFSLGDASVELEPAEPEPSAVTEAVEDVASRSPLDDPATFGFAGAEMPEFRRRRPEAD